MKTADEMLNDIGYVKYLDNEETIIYKYERETFRISLTFDKRPFKKTFHAVEGLWVKKMKVGTHKNLKMNGISIVQHKVIGLVFGTNFQCKNYKQ